MDNTPQNEIQTDLLSDLDIEDAVLPDETIRLLEAARAAARQSRYYKVAIYWLSRGCPVIPGRRENKAPFELGWTDYADGVRTLNEDEILRFALSYPDATPLLLTGAGKHRFVVVDVDDPAHLEWALQTFGRTPFVVSTGREGGGFHLYYLVPYGVTISQANGEIGPEAAVQTWDYRITAEGKIVKSSKKVDGTGKSWGRTTLDIKSSHNYVVAPGAVHRSGLVYRPQGTRLSEITPEWITTNVPVFPHEKLETLKQEHRARRAAKDAEILATLTPEQKDARHQRLGAAQMIGGVAVSTGIEEPFFAWCREDPTAVTMRLWFALGTNLYAAHGAAGEMEFHSISALDSSRYDVSSANTTWRNAVRHVDGGKPPTSYKGIVADGSYTGAVAPHGTAPAQYLSLRDAGVTSGDFTFDGSSPRVRAVAALAPPAPNANPARVGAINHLSRIRVVDEILADEKRVLHAATAASVEPVLDQRLGVVSGQDVTVIHQGESRIVWKWQVTSSPWTDTEEEVERIEETHRINAHVEAASKTPAYVAAMPPPAPPKEFPSELVVAAQRAIQASNHYISALRENWVAQGLKHGGFCHSVKQVLQQAGTGKIRFHPRRCDKFTCRNCGPQNVMAKAMAVAHLPILDSDGRVVGASFAERPVYVHLVERTVISNWRRKFSRRKADVPTQPMSLPSKAHLGHLPADAYVIFDPAISVEVLILSTVNLGGEVVAADDLEALLAMATAWTYQPMIPGASLFVDALDGMPLEVAPAEDPTVTGTITSSHGLRLDPDDILTLARGSQHTLLARLDRPLKEAQQIARDLGHATKARTRTTLTDADQLEEEVVGVEVATPPTEEAQKLLLRALESDAPSVATLLAQVAESATRPPVKLVKPDEFTHDELDTLLSA